MLLSPSLFTGPGSFATPPKCSRWEGSCAECGTSRTWTQGMFCANFYSSVAGCLPCHKMWCRKCHCSPTNPKFPVVKEDTVKDNSGEDNKDRIVSGFRKKKDVSHRFLRARDGDHLLAPFECDVFTSYAKESQFQAHPPMVFFEFKNVSRRWKSFCSVGIFMSQCLFARYFELCC